MSSSSSCACSTTSKNMKGLKTNLTDDKAILLKSVKKNDIETIQKVIQKNKSLRFYEYPYTKRTILLTACLEKEIEPETVETLIELGASLKGNALFKPLHLAAQHPNSRILEVIIKYLDEGQINETLNGDSALHYLIRNINKDEEKFCTHVELLLEANIDVNQGDSNNISAIWLAAWFGYKCIVRKILENGKIHVDLDGHKTFNKTARELIIKKNLYDGILPKRVQYKLKEAQLFSLIKESKEDEFIECFNYLKNQNKNYSYANSNDSASTLLQYACKRGLDKLVKFLISEGAFLNLTIENEEKSPMEIAAENGYFQILEILLENPNTNISTQAISYIIKKFYSKKSNKVDYEKCCRIILKKFNPLKNDVNEKDKLTNTMVYYSLRYASEDITEKLLKMGASLASKNKFNIMPIEDIKPETLENYLNNCIELEEDDEKFEIVLNYRNLVPPRGRQNEFDFPNLIERNEAETETDAILYISQDQNLKHLLKHPVIIGYLSMKWDQTYWLFCMNLFLYIIFVASLIFHIIFDFGNFSNKNTGNISLSKFLLGLTFFILVLREVILFFVLPKRYLRILENIVEISLTILILIVTGMILFINSPSDDTRKQLSSADILLVTFKLLLMYGFHPKLTTNVMILRMVCLNFFKLLLFYSILILGFALNFSFLFAQTQVLPNMNGTDDNPNPFKNFGESLFKTLIMLTGELNVDPLYFNNSIPNSFYSIFSRTIFLFFVFMITIILLNLLTGLAVSVTDAMVNDIKINVYTLRAQYISYVENAHISSSFYKFFKFFVRKNFFYSNCKNCNSNFCKSKCHIKGHDLQVIISDKEYAESFLGKEIVKKIMNIIRERKSTSSPGH